MRLTWVGRQLLAVPLITLVLVVVSGVLRLTTALQVASRQTSVEARLVTQGVQRELERLAVGTPSEALARVADDRRVRSALLDGLAYAPSVLHVAVLDLEGNVVAHTLPSHVGTTAQTHPPLPEIGTFFDSLGLLRDLVRSPPTYQMETSLLLDGSPYATIQVVVAGAFLRDAVLDAASRGLVVAVILVSLAFVVGFVLAHFALGRIRLLEAGVAALREGRRPAPLPVSGADEFSRLARELNLLGEQFEKERTRGGKETEGEGTSGEGRRPPVDASRVLARLGQAASGLAHELRNKLQSIQLDLESLRSSGDGDRGEMRGLAESAAREVEELGGTVSGFLKIARVRPLAIEDVDTGSLLEEIHGEFAQECDLAGVRLALEIEESPPGIRADPQVLRQAIHNLLRNALQALVGREDGRIELRAAPVDGTLRITVADNGPGIPSDVLGQVFELYFTTRKDGSGVGLALVRQAVEMHGGTIEIDSGEGSGTRVTLVIPASDVTRSRARAEGGTERA